MIYNVVTMLYHWRYEKIKTYQIKMNSRKQYIFSVITMECNIPRDSIKSQSGGKHKFSYSHLDFLIPLTRKKNLAVFSYKQNWRENTQIPPKTLSACCESAYRWILVSGYHKYNYVKSERRGWDEGINWVEIRGRVEGINSVVKVSGKKLIKETEG